MTILESKVRDHFAARYVNAQTEVRTPFGRVDVVARGYVIEVKHYPQWRRAVRQALAYSKETGLAPAVAVYGDMTADEAVRLYEECDRSEITVFLLSGRRWRQVQSLDDAARRWLAPPSDLKPTPSHKDWRSADDRTEEDIGRAAADAMDRAMAGWRARQSP